MIDERLMAPGTFTVDVDPRSPERIKELTDYGFSQIVVTPTRVDADAVDAADLLGVALYTGIMRGRSGDRCRWTGAGLPILLGDEDGKANTHTAPAAVAARPLYDGSNTSWVRSNVLRPGAGGSNGVVVGTITSAASPTKAGNIEAGDSPRDVLDFACDLFSSSGGNPYEWSIDTRGRLSVAPRNTLFPTTVTPTALATRRTEVLGLPATLDVLPVSRFDLDDDWEDWSSQVFVTGPTVPFFDTEYTYTGSADIAVNPFVDLLGDELVMRRVVMSNKSKSNATNEAIAERKLGRFDDLARRLSLSTPLAGVRDLVGPGDSVYVEDLDADLVDLALQVEAGAGCVFPMVVRVAGMVWPVVDGMGVYLVRAASGGLLFPAAGSTVVDVSDFVVFESGDARLSVGEPRRSLLGWRPRWLAA